MLDYETSKLKLRKNMKILGELKLTSSSFDQETCVPDRYRFDYGDNVHPEFGIHNSPEGVKSFVMTLEDKDSPGSQMLHWIVWNIPGDTNFIEEGKLPEGSFIGKNSWSERKYYGPCPVQGSHEYVFILWALDCTLDLRSDVNADGVYDAMDGHVIDCARLYAYCKKLGQFSLE